MPIALPAALYASSELGTAAVFALTVLVVAPGSHAILQTLHKALPRGARLPVLVVLASGLLAIAELGWRMALGTLPVSDAMMLRALAVSGLVVWPEIVAGGEDSAAGGVRSAFGLAFGFAFGLALLTAIRFGIAAFGIEDAGGLPVALLVLASGRALLGLRDRRKGAS